MGRGGGEGEAEKATGAGGGGGAAVVEASGGRSGKPVGSEELDILQNGPVHRQCHRRTKLLVWQMAWWGGVSQVAGSAPGAAVAQMLAAEHPAADIAAWQ